MRKLLVMLGITCLVLSATGCGEDFAHSVREMFGIAHDSTTPPPANHVPSVTLTASPATGAIPLDTTLTAVATDSDGTIAGYEFDFGEGAGFGASAAAATASHSYATAGTFTTRVRATDNDGATATAQATIVASVAGAPTATIKGEVQVKTSPTGAPVTFGPAAGVAVYLFPAADVPVFAPGGPSFPLDARVNPPGTPAEGAMAFGYTGADGMFTLAPAVPYGDYVLFRLMEVSKAGDPLAYVRDHEAITVDAATVSSEIFTALLAQLNPTNTGGGGSGGSGVLPAFSGRIFMPDGITPAFGAAVFVTASPSNPADGTTQPTLTYPTNLGKGASDGTGLYTAPDAIPSALTAGGSYYVTAVLDEAGGAHRRWRATTTTAVPVSVPGDPTLPATQNLILVIVPH